MVNNPQMNSIGTSALIISTLNSFFQMLNPVLTGIFYILSISWLIIQIYHKSKSANKE
jgi:hypothetical protein